MCIATRLHSLFKNVVCRLKIIGTRGGDMNPILRGAPTDIRRHHTEVSRLDDLPLGVCALQYGLFENGVW